MRPVLLLVTYTAKPQGRERFLQQVTQNGILEAIRREEGCGPTTTSSVRRTTGRIPAGGKVGR